MNCPQCQTQNGPEASFCSRCGAPLAAAASAPAGSAEPGGPSAPPSYGGPTGYPPAGGQPPFPPGQPPFQPGQYQPGTSGGFTQRSNIPAANFDLSRLTTVDKVVAVASFITMISIWMPWFTVSYTLLGHTDSASASGTGVHGWLWLEFIVALALIAYLAARAAWAQLPFSLPLSHEVLLIAATGLQFLLVLIGFVAVPSTDGLAGFSVGWGFGAFLALIASIVAAGPVIYPAVKSYLDSRNAARA
jgi:hypothetical protein